MVQLVVRLTADPGVASSNPSSAIYLSCRLIINPCPAEAGYTLPLQTV